MKFYAPTPLLLVFLATITTLSPATSWSQLSVSSVSGASNYEEDSNGNVTLIYGGIAGVCTGDGSSTCNSCTAAETSCNEKRIYSGLELRIDFNITDDISGQVCVGYEENGSYNRLTGADTSGGTLSKGDSGYVEIDWSDLCFVDGASDCLSTTNTRYKLQIGLDSSCTSTVPDSSKRIDILFQIAHPPDASGAEDQLTCAAASPATGVCDFLAFPGDEKVYIDVGASDVVSDWPNMEGTDIKYLRMYYTAASATNTDFSNTNYTTATYHDFEIDDSGTLQSNKIEGLTNETTYFFRSAIVDAAMNVSFLIDDDNQIDTTNCPTKTDAACDMMATPSKVAGLLAEDLNCFISTAAYGSPMADEVRHFRRFRNKFLLRNSLGQMVHKLYYNYGPKLARPLSQHQELKPLARALLWPLLQFVKFSNHYGLKTVMWFSFGILMSVFILIFGGRKFWHKHS